MTLSLNRRGIHLKCLGQTKDGFPRHPVRLRADTILVPFEPFGGVYT